MKSGRLYRALGEWLAAKAQRQATEIGVQQAAKNLRKQGVPLELVLLVLSRKGNP